MAYTLKYAELHCHSNFSFLDGVSDPSELAKRASQLGYSALAITDHGGFYGAVRFAEAGRLYSLPTVFGAELAIHGDPADGTLMLYEGSLAGRSLAFGAAERNLSFRDEATVQGPPDEGESPGAHVVVLATGPCGYSALSRVISRGNLRGSKGRPLHRLSDLVGLEADCLFLTGACPLSIDPRALAEVVDRSRVLLELTNGLTPEDASRNEAKRTLASREHFLTVATNNVHHALREEAAYAQAVSAIRRKRSLEDPAVMPFLYPSPERYLKSAEEMAELVDPESVGRAGDIGACIAFDLSLAAPPLPRFETPPGKSEAEYLRELVAKGAAERYPPPGNEKAMSQIEHELSVIEGLGYEGYFLIVWDIVRYCREAGILCQGRGSAANSAVCYALGITNADPIALDLLFERFLSPERDGPPDIDLDIEHERREEVIQYVYAKYGRNRAAQVANLVTYRERLAIRDASRALGLTPGQSDALSRRVGGFTEGELEDAVREARLPSPTAEHLVETAKRLSRSPRHLGIHTGGMVLTARDVWEVCPVEWASRPGRTVLQWDKDDCAAMGLVKFDLLGLGMLSCIRRCLELVLEHRGIEVDLARIPQEPEVYETISAADTMGVFQIESRAQMGALPRVRPRCFYDLVVQVALIRPGPIQGESVHPYIRRRRGEEAVSYPHPLLEPALRKTLGVPIFQEQLMRIAMDAAGFSASQADRLRQALSHKRSRERLGELEEELFEGMRRNGIPEEVAEEIFKKLLGFADFGFPESHAASFAYLVYASAWLRYHYPAEYLCAILNSQPMGFYSPNSLVADARRHGVEVLNPDVCESEYDCTLTDRSPPTHAGKPVLLGLRYIRNLGECSVLRILEARQGNRGEGGRAFSDFYDFVERTGLGRRELESLAMAGALESLGISRTEGLWRAGAASRLGSRGRTGRDVGPAPGSQLRLPRIGSEVRFPAGLREMSPLHKVAAELWAMGISPDSHLMNHYRPLFTSRGICSVAEALRVPDRTRVRVAGVITHKQRPSTAGGTLFLNLEDETGTLNVIVDKKTFAKHTDTLVDARSVLVEGVLEKRHGSANLIAGRIENLRLAAALPSRDFR